ncbi:MAG TPA: TetR/AcrR family transcriptional regulator [Fibrobacteria bacterium]|nr:TetR/AcrR family transcriptional regulator [Fibrobacteria bacterium]
MRRKEGDKASEILNAAIRIFARDGFDKAQVSAIAAVAGVGTGSIYLYFTGKTNILHIIFSRFWDHLSQEMATLQNRDPLFRLNDQLGLFFDHLAADRDLARVYLREHHRFLETATAQERHGYAAALETGRAAFLEIATGRGDGSPQPDQVGMDLSQAFLFGGVRSALEFLLSSDIPAEKVRSNMLTMAMAGILAATRRPER